MIVKTTKVFSVSTLIIMLVMMVVPMRAFASLDNRSITISTAQASANASYTFSYTATGTHTIGSVRFEFCSNDPLIQNPCTVPAGLNTAAATLTAQIGDVGYSVHPDTTLTSNAIIITRAPSVSNPGAKTYTFTNITNPSFIGSTYVRVSHYSTIDATGPYDDWNGLVYSISRPLAVNVFVPPFIIMCHAATIAEDCSTVGPPLIDLGELSSSNPTVGTTQFSIATNSGNGFAASIFGSTMTAGNRTISPMLSTSPSITGTSQFGINLVPNAVPSVGQSPTGIGTAVSTANYSVPNQFRFVSGETIATAAIATYWNRFTISYVVNIPNGQSAGRYASTISVIAATTF